MLAQPIVYGGLRSPLMHLAAACASEAAPMLSRSPRQRALADAKIDALVMLVPLFRLRRGTHRRYESPFHCRNVEGACFSSGLLEPRLVSVRYFRQYAYISDRWMLDAALTVFKRVETRAPK